MILMIYYYFLFFRQNYTIVTFGKKKFNFWKFVFLLLALDTVKGFQEFIVK